MASPNNFNFPYFPPPPHQPSRPPPPLPPPSKPPPPPPSPDNSTSVIIVVFVSFGCVLLLAFLAFALCCFLKKKNKQKKTVQETDVLRVDEHLRVKEAIIGGPRGPQAVVLAIEDDVHVEEETKKNVKLGEGLHGKKAADSAIVDSAGTSTSHIEHQELQNRG